MKKEMNNYQNRIIKYNTTEYNTTILQISPITRTRVLLNNDSDQTYTVISDLDLIQFRFSCCGMDGYLDWNKTDFGYHKNLIIVPDSCCKNWIVQDSSKSKIHLLRTCTFQSGN